MNRCFKNAVFAAAALLIFAGLTGCGTAGRNYTKSAMQETLEVEIRPDTSKMFTYRLRWPEDKIPSNIRIDRGAGFEPGSHSGGIEVSSGTYARLQENAAFAVSRSGYCREGFFELDKRISRYQLWLRGECKESASAEDLARFKEPQSLPPSAWAKRS